MPIMFIRPKIKQTDKYQTDGFYYECTYDNMGVKQGA